jgi:hypothetical protein
MLPPASLISHFTTMRSPAANVVDVGVSIQVTFAALPPSSVPCSVLRKAASSLVVYRCTVTCMPAFAAPADSWPQVLSTTGPAIVTSAASGGEIHWSRVPPAVLVHCTPSVAPVTVSVTEVVSPAPSGGSMRL